MEKSSKKPEWAVGDLVAWESQAAGSCRAKIGTIIVLPRPDIDQRTSASKVRIKVMASYPLNKESDIGKAKGAIRANGTQAEGRASFKSLRKPTAAEFAVIA